MATLGFTYYDTKPVPTVPSIQEIIDGMTGPQKVAVLDGFAKKILPKNLSYDVSGLKRSAIIRLYKAIDSIEELSRKYMRGEILVTPEELDENGNVVTPAVYNTPPTTQTELRDVVANSFSDDFTLVQVNAILTKMVEYSKWDGTGDWAFYSTEVVK